MSGIVQSAEYSGFTTVAYDFVTTGGILTGNYGMWNSYCLVMMWIYAPSVSTATTHRGQGSTSNTLVDDPESLQKFISKKSQE